MNVTVKQLLKRRVAEVMCRDVITVSANATMIEASQVLLENGVGGAPVVDELGKCVGVLSLVDFARHDLSLPPEGSASSFANEFTLERDIRSGVLRIEHTDEGYVHQHMSTAVQCIDGEETLLAAARVLHAEKIHRLIVLDSSERPIGVLGSLDILGAFVESAEG